VRMLRSPSWRRLGGIGRSRTGTGVLPASPEDLCEKARFHPELALSRLCLAEVLLEHYPGERAEALEHLDFAISGFQEMKMQPSLERALRLRDILVT